MFNVVGLVGALYIVVRSVGYAIKYSGKVASNFGFSTHTIGFILIAGISVMPETVISLSAAFNNESGFGLGTLFGSNVADLALIFGVITLLAKNPISVASSILDHTKYYSLILATPLLLGIDGSFSRLDGLVLLIIGCSFHLWIIRNDMLQSTTVRGKHRWQDWLFLLLSLAVLIVGSQFIIKFAIAFANDVGISPILVGMFIVALGTTLPELIFSVKAVRQSHPSLALGDILGTVMTDATIVVGLLALFRPFTFPLKIILSTGVFMLVASLLLFYYMKTGRSLTKKEAAGLILFYSLFVLTELALDTYVD